MMMATQKDGNQEREETTPEGKQNLDRISQQVHNLFKFWNFFDKMDRDTR